MADSDDRGVGEQLHAAVPVLVLDGDGRDNAVFGVDEERFAHAELAPFRDADDRQIKDFYAFFGHWFFLLCVDIFRTAPRRKRIQSRVGSPGGFPRTEYSASDAGSVYVKRYQDRRCFSETQPGYRPAP